MADTGPLRIGTRGSPLALAQAKEVQQRLAAAHPDLPPAEIAVIRTTGDRVQDRKLEEIGGKGLFTKEIEEALILGHIDLAVHSMKDMPTLLPPGLIIGCLLPREDPRDALFSPHAASLAGLPKGARVGTSALRRQAQILALRPDLQVQLFRGNVGTRLAKLAAGEVDATLLALAGLKRLGLADKATAILGTEEMLPAVAQGAIGVEIRADDDRIATLLAPLNDTPTAESVTAERACLEVLDGSCRTPIAALAEHEPGGILRLRALIALPDGSAMQRAERRAPRAQAMDLGRGVGEAL
ncbi:MAG TPA: hydroxymethylbilane synthase, partial [Verrucomicrobiae bacterium]|nr:hydroxymethylbilane synthase [Verrucomicrobiae bacterium]